MRRPTLLTVGNVGVSDSAAPRPAGATEADAERSDSTGGPGDVERYQQLFHGHFVAMTRLATMLGADDPEDVAQEAFVRLHRRRRTLRDPHASVGYLRTTVVNLSRSRVRHLAVVRRNPMAAPDADSAEQHAVRREDARELVAALGRLSTRHREALVLRYWLDLSEAEMADAMGVSRGTVKAHVSRGLDALATIMEGTR